MTARDRSQTITHVANSEAENLVPRPRQRFLSVGHSSAKNSKAPASAAAQTHREQYQKSIFSSESDCVFDKDAPARNAASAALVNQSLEQFLVRNLFSASWLLSEALSQELEEERELLLAQESRQSDYGTVELGLPGWMEGDDYIAGRQSGYFGVLKARLEDALKLVSSAPRHVKGYLQCGSLLCILNRWEEAREVYHVGLTKCEETKQIQSALDELNAVEQSVMSVVHSSKRQYSTASASSKRSLGPPSHKATKTFGYKRFMQHFRRDKISRSSESSPPLTP